MGSPPARRGNGELLPGPGNYDVKSGFDNRGGKFGAEPRDKARTIDGPGPGQYGAREFIGKDAPKVSMGGRVDKARMPDGPGPGAYNYNDGKKGGFSMGIKPKDRPLGDGPGPGAYVPEYKNVKPRQGVAGMGKAGRDNMKVPDGPGPGAYYSPGKSKGGITMAGRPKDKLGGDGPGPGAYDGRYDVTKERAPGVKMGQPTPAKGIASDTPGPGNYDTPGYINPKGKAGGFSFGKEQKVQKPSDTPGPG